jgi:hypothetical protein
MAVALVSLRLRRWPRRDLAVLGAFNLEGQLLPSEKLGPQHMAVLRTQGFNAMVVTDARRMLDEQVRRGPPSSTPPRHPLRRPAPALAGPPSVRSFFFLVADHANAMWL